METSYLAIVTGGAQGIGRAITSTLLEAGAKVHFLDVNVEEGEKAQKQFDEKYGAGKSKFVLCDVSDSDQLEKAFVAAKSELGGLNVVCNNAGITSPVFDRIRWPKVIAVNLTATIHGTLLGLDLMGTNKGGAGGVIINTSAIAGLRPVPIAPVYSGTKHGIIGFSRSLAPMSISEKVRINCICPDGTDTTLVANSVAELLPVFSIDEIQSMLAKHVYCMDIDTNKGPDLQDDKSASLLLPSEIGKEVLTLVKDETKNGEALVISKVLGTYFQKFN